MKKVSKKVVLIVSIVLSLIVSSCNASWHFAKAIKKDPSIVKNDTVTVVKIVPEVSDSVSAIDSLIVDNNDLYIKAVASGKIDLLWKLKERVDTISTSSNTVEAPKKRIEIRKEKRNERSAKTQEEKTKRTEVRQGEKTERQVVKSEEENGIKLKHLLLTLLFGIMLGFIIKSNMK